MDGPSAGAEPPFAVREATRADLRWIVGAVKRLGDNGTAADPRFRLAAGAEQRLADHFAHAWFGRFQPFPPAWIAASGGAPIGLVTGEVTPDAGILERPPTARIDNLWVEVEHRRGGVARALVSRFRERAVAAGFPALQVSTLIRDARAVAFWRAMGLTELHVILASDAPAGGADADTREQRPL